MTDINQRYGLNPPHSEVVSTCQLIEPCAALDMGCSNGRNALYLSQQGAEELGNAESRERMQLKDRTHFREHYIEPSLALNLIEMTIPDKPRSRLQTYRLRAQGYAALSVARNPG